MIRSNFSLEQYHAFSDVSGPSDESVSGPSDESVSGPSDESVSGVAPPPSPED
jgi:hypothetical protein